MIFLPISTDSITALLKDTMAIVGSVGALFAAGFGIWLAGRKRREAKLKQERQEDQNLSDKFTDIETSVIQLQAGAQVTEKQYTEIQAKMDRDIKTLVQRADELKLQCTRHQQTSDIEDLEREVKRLVDRVDQLNRDLVQHREQVTDRYLTITSYQSDLTMLTSNFDALRQSIRDLTLLFGKTGR